MRIEPAEGLRYLYEHPEVPAAVDTESTGLKVKDGRDRAIGASVAYRNLEDRRVYSFYIAWGHVVGKNHDPRLKKQLDWVLSQGRTLVYHNATFDWFSLYYEGVKVVQQPFYDTLTMANLINENTIQKSLDALTHLYLGRGIKLSEWQWPEFPLEIEKKTGWANTTPRMMDEYARLDTEATLLLWEHFMQHKRWVEIPEDVWESKAEQMRILWLMTKRGVEVDQGLTATLLAEGEAAKERVVRELGGLNPGSIKDREELFIHRLDLPVLKRSEKTKKPSFDKTVMADYDKILEQKGDPTAKLVKEWRGWNTACGLLLRPYLELVSPDGRLRTTFNTHVTATGRLSASDPNLQQISKDGGSPWNDRIKKCFRPAEGFKLINCDYSQLELRLGAGYADEKSLKQVFNEGRDIFTEMAAQLGFTRQQTKTLVYSMQYGAGVNRIKNVFGVSEAQARQIIQKYRDTFPGFTKLNDVITAMAERDMEVPLWTGRKRHLQYKSEGFKAMNSVIQGGAADIVERAMIRCFNEFDSDDCRLLLTVHDSLVWEIREDLVDELTPQITAMMSDVDAITASRGDSFGVKFAVEAEEW